MRSSPLIHPAISPVSASLGSMFIEADHTTSAAPVADGRVSTLLGDKPGHETIRLVVANPDRKQDLRYLSADFCQVWPEMVGRRGVDLEG